MLRLLFLACCAPITAVVLPRPASIHQSPASLPIDAVGSGELKRENEPDIWPKANGQTDTVPLPGFNHLIDDHAAHQDDDATALTSSLSGDITTMDNTCRTIELTGDGKKGQTTLWGRCLDAGGIWWQTSINLNDCMRNNGGELVYFNNGHFDDTCRPCLLEPAKVGSGLVITCDCMDTNGNQLKTSLDMGTEVNHPLAVRPVDGRLGCGPVLGTKSPTFS